MTYQPTDFKTALDMDMAALQINERVLGERLGGLSQQAISKWRSRGFPPAYRWEQLLAVLGPNSYTARLSFPSLVGTPTRLRVEPPANVPQVPEGEQSNRVAASARSLSEKHNADAAWARVLDLLPPALRPTTARSSVRAGRVSAQVDYLGPNLVMDFVVSTRPNAPANISQPLLKLAALRAGDPTRRAVLCLLAPAGAETVRVRIGYGEALGVETWVVSSEEEAASRIVEAVEDLPEPPDHDE